MAQNFQITQVASNGNVISMHPETNADQILAGTVHKVPEIDSIKDWTNKSNEVVNARKGEINLKAKIDKIDISLTPGELLKSLKTVDGINSELDADKVDGCDVNDNSTSSNSLWSSNKVQVKLNEKVNNLDVVTSPTPRKLLKLNENGDLPANITGRANTATSLASGLKLNFTGDVSGSTVFTGKEGSVNVSIDVKDNSHAHNNIAGVFVDNNKQDNLSLWTALKVSQELTKLATETEEFVNNQFKVNEEEILLGSLKIKFGSIDISKLTKAEVVFKQPFKTLLFNGHSCETADTDLIANVVPNSVSNLGVKFNMNKAVTNGKIIWFAIGL